MKPTPLRPNHGVTAKVAALLMVAIAFAVVVPGALAAVNTTAIDDMSTTLIALMVALIPIAVILAFWAKMRGIWALGVIVLVWAALMCLIFASVILTPGAAAAVNTTAIDDMSTTLIALIVALVPIAFILAFWAKMKGIW